MVRKFDAVIWNLYKHLWIFCYSAEYTYSADGGKLTKTEDGFKFVSDKEGIFEITVKAVDEKGNTAEEKWYVTVEDKNGSEEEGAYVAKAEPEHTERKLIASSEPSETIISQEMADLADKLETPLAIYEYLYNNIDTEYYKGSRKGALGTYEQNGGNDVDCASLLIAMLRYKGYDAQYVTGTIGVTEDQFMEMTGTSTIEDAKTIWGIHGGNLLISPKTNSYYFDHTWVRTVIDEKTYDLDISFKKYEQVLSLDDAVILGATAKYP